jgi:transcriptional regulator with XRE-family HTH domain
VSIAPDIQAFKARITEVLRSRGLTHEQFAGLLETSQSTVSPWLNQEKADMPKGPHMMRLPLVLGVSAHWLLTGEGSPEPPGATETAVYERGRERGWLEAIAALQEAHRATITPQSEDRPSPAAILGQAVQGKPKKGRKSRRRA